MPELGTSGTIRVNASLKQRKETDALRRVGKMTRSQFTQQKFVGKRLGFPHCYPLPYRLPPEECPRS